MRIFCAWPKNTIAAPAGASFWSVPDPVRDGTDAAFDAAFEDIAARIQSLAPRLTTTKG